ncbi:MAG: hypothetical protein ACP5PA_04050 [Elusimicrobiales bacterium]
MREIITIIVFYLVMVNIVGLIIYSDLFASKEFRMSVSDTEGSNVSISTAAFFFPQSTRNPFLSPMDYEIIKKMEEEKRKRDELLKRMDEESKKNKPTKKQDPVDDYIRTMKLQGIVGRYAIINGVMVEEGRYYTRKKILIEKIFSNYVIINYKGKRYKLVIK